MNTLATTWSASHLTDGVVPIEAVQALAGARFDATKAAQELIAVQLWRDASTGYEIIDYLRTNPSARLVRKLLKENAKRVRRWRRSRDGVRNALRTPHASVERSGVEKKKKEDPKQLGLGTDPTSARASFARFWSAYPWHLARQDAEAAWRKLAPEAALVEAICAAIAWQRERGCLRPAVGRDGKPVRLYPATYVNGRRWEDEPEPLLAAPPVSPLMAAAIERVSTRAAVEAMRGTRAR